MRWWPWLLLTCACHPLSLYAPPELPKEGPLVLAGNPALHAEVEVRVDGRGVPHVSAQSEEDAAFAVGFMHARDRQFQLLLMKHAAEGRLTELFGERALPLDRRLRLSAFGTAQQLDGLTPKDRALLESYCAGVRAGVKQAGKSAEMALLGQTLDSFTPFDALAILRLQAWQLSQDFQDELARELLLSRLAPGDARRRWFDLPASTGGLPIVPSPVQALPPRPVAPPDARAPVESGAAAPERWSPFALQLAERLGLFSSGASNSWVVAPELTASGHPMLLNDPHLTHGLPGVFYLAQVTTPTLSVEGATLPGAPMVVIGFGRHVAWGITAAYADVQDVLRLQVAPDDTNVYLVDGVRVPFDTLEQRYVLGHSKDAKVTTETWKVSRFGPVLPQGVGGWNLAGGPYALAWGAYLKGPRGAKVVSSWYELARAQGLDEAAEALQGAAAADVSVVLAATDGRVGYRLEALVPRRPEGATGRTVRRGDRASDALQLVDPSELPKLDGAERGFIVAANQRVVDDADPRAATVGTAGVEPSRATRIKERLKALTAGGHKATVSELLAIQQDSVSPHARALAPLLGAHCPARLEGVKEARLKAFCDLVKRFDGDFKVDSRGALPFVAYFEALEEQVALSVLAPEEAALAAKSPVMQRAVTQALEEKDGSLFGDLDALAARAAGVALAEVSKLAGDDPRGWRWGKVHRRTPRSPLAAAPVVGGFFELPSEEQAGWWTSPRAEAPLEVEHGAVLRMAVELSDPPVGYLVLDTGQSGVPRTPHFYDQHQDWNRGTPPRVPYTSEEVKASTVAKVLLRP